MELEKNNIFINMDVLKARLFDELTGKVTPNNAISIHYRLMAYSEVINILEEYSIDSEVVYE